VQDVNEVGDPASVILTLNVSRDPQAGHGVVVGKCAIAE